MSFNEYKNYSSTELETIFKVKIIAEGNLFILTQLAIVILIYKPK